MHRSTVHRYPSNRACGSCEMVYIRMKSGASSITASGTGQACGTFRKATDSARSLIERGTVSGDHGVLDRAQGAGGPGSVQGADRRASAVDFMSASVDMIELIARTERGGDKIACFGGIIVLMFSLSLLYAAPGVPRSNKCYKPES
jgi:hypothetical protein